jgi:hypothetical protein
VPQHQESTSKVKDELPKCPECGASWTTHPGTERSEWKQTPQAQLDVFKSKEWGSSADHKHGWGKFQGWGKPRPFGIHREFFFSIRLEALLKRLKLRGLTRSTNCEIGLSSADEAWIKEKMRLVQAAGDATEIKDTDEPASDWLAAFIAKKAKKKVLQLNFADIEQALGVALPPSYKEFTSKVGSRTFKDVDEEEGFNVRILLPKDLDFHGASQPDEAESDDDHSTDGLIFAATEHGDTFCFDTTSKGPEFEVLHHDHETDIFEPYAGNFAEFIRRLAG